MGALLPSTGPARVGGGVGRGVKGVDALGVFQGVGRQGGGVPSTLAADLARLAKEVERGGAELVHFDVMDNHFVPNLTMGPVVDASLVRATELPVDAHLVVSNPDNLIPASLEAGVSSISVHEEAAPHLHRTLTAIRSGGVEAGVALNPATSPETIEWALPYLDFILVMSVNPGFGDRALSRR